MEETINLDEMSLPEIMHSVIQRIATGPTLSKDIEEEEARRAMHAVLKKEVDEVQAAIFLIALRMKRETEAENRGILSAIRDLTNTAIADVDEVVDLADPYNGYNRTLPVVPFLPALLAELGLPAVSHGLVTVSPKFGVTHHQILQAAGLKIDLSTEEVAKRLSDPAIGWGYVDQAQFCPTMHGLIGLRKKMIKRSVLTTVETLVGPIRGKNKTHLVSGYVHKPYSAIYAMLARHSGFDTNLSVRGIEGGVTASLRQSSTMFQYHDKGAEQEFEVDPTKLGIQREERAPAIPEGVEGNENIAKAAADAGIAALQGKEGASFDALLLSASLALYHLKRCSSLEEAAGQVRAVLESGKAASRFQ